MLAPPVNEASQDALPAAQRGWQSLPAALTATHYARSPCQLPPHLGTACSCCNGLQPPAALPADATHWLLAAGGASRVGSSDALLSTSFKPLLHGAASGGVQGPVQRALEAVVRQLNQEQVSCLSAVLPSYVHPCQIVNQRGRHGPQQLAQPGGRSVQYVSHKT